LEDFVFTKKAITIITAITDKKKQKQKQKQN